MLNGYIDLQLTPDGRIGLGLDGLEVTIIDGAEAVRNGSRTSVDHAEERGFDSRPPLHTFDFGAAGRHGNHRRWNRPDPSCARCVGEASHRPDIAPDRLGDRPPIAPDRQATDPRLDPPDRPDIAPMHRSNDDDTTSSSIDSPSDLPLSYAVLLRKYSRGGQRPGHVSRATVTRIRTVMACRDETHDDAWCAEILDGARGNALRGLEQAHTLAHAPPAPDPTVQAEAIEADRRRQAYVLRDQLERGVDDAGRPLGELARQVVQRQLTRLEPQHPPQGP